MTDTSVGQESKLMGGSARKHASQALNWIPGIGGSWAGKHDYEVSPFLVFY